MCTSFLQNFNIEHNIYQFTCSIVLTFKKNIYSNSSLSKLYTHKCIQTISDEVITYEINSMIV